MTFNENCSSKGGKNANQLHPSPLSATAVPKQTKLAYAVLYG